MAVRLGEVISGAWLSWCEGVRTRNSVHDRDGNDAKRQCMEEVKWKWEVEPQKRVKLGVMQRLLVHGSKNRHMDVKCKRLRRILATLRGGTETLLRIETGR